MKSKPHPVFNTFILCLGIFCWVFYLGLGLAVTFRQSMLWLWPLAGSVCILRWWLVRRAILTGVPVAIPRTVLLLWRICLGTGLSLFFFTAILIAVGSFSRPEPKLDCVIVLGAKVNGTAPSGALHQRIHAAAAYLRDNPDTLCIASGGQGTDEGISEAECIRRGLVSLGIEDGRILLEEQSTDTQTNMKNSFALLPPGTESVGIVTSDFHVFRAKLLAETIGGYRFSGIPARSSAAGYLHYTVREFCALVVTILEGDIRLR